MNATRSMILMDRLVLGGATDRDWAEWTEWADANPDAWRQLALAQREQQLLTDFVDGHAQIADAIDLPDIDEALTEDDAIVARIGSYERDDVDADDRTYGWTRGGEVGRDMRHRAMSQRTWSRLAVAALVLLTLTITQFMMSNTGNAPGDGQAGLGPINPVNNSQEALQQYLDLGREEGTVLDEIPTMVLIDAKPNPNGSGYVVLCVRQIVESFVVPELYYQDGTTDTGAPVMAEYAPAAMRSY